MFLLLLLLLLNVHSALCETVLVTGGAGFIGSHVTEKLLERGDRVVIVDNISCSNENYASGYNAQKRRNLQILKNKFGNDAFILYETDITEASALNAIFDREQPTLICHLAARAGVRGSLNDPFDYISVNVQGTVSVLEAVRKHGCKNIVLASSSSVYGETDKIPFAESLNTDCQNSPYGATKKATELFASVYHRMYGLSCTCLRFFTVYGPRGRHDMSPFIFLDAVYTGRPLNLFGDGSIRRDFTYIDDIVDGIIRALDRPLGFEIINLGKSTTTSIHDFIELIENVVGKKAIVNYKPTLLEDVTLTYSDISKARRLLGYDPKVDVAYGIKKMFDWYINDYCKIKP